MRKTAKRLLGFLLTAVLVAGMLPAGSIAFAADEEVKEVITFVGTSSAYIQVEEVTYYGAKGQKPNWKYFGSSGTWTNKMIRQLSGDDANDLRLKADSGAGAWLALMIDFNNEALTPGVYSLSMKTTYRDAPNNGAAGARFWFAEADPTISKENAADYMTATNLIKEASSSDPIVAAKGTNVLTEDIIINDPTAEHVLVVEYQSDMRLSIEDFTFTRIDDIPAVELATEETFSFENGLTNGNILEANYNEYEEATNPDWKFFDKSADYDDYPDYTKWAGLAYKSSSRNDGKSFVKIADAYKSGTVDIADAWSALKLDPESSLQTGKYQLSLDLITVNIAQGNGRSAKKMAVYLAEYVEGEENGEYYKTTANQIMPLTAVSASESSPATVTAPVEFYITNSDAEYVLVIELEGAEIWLTDFTLTRTGDLPVVELATEETFAFVNNTSADKNMETYLEYAPTGGDNPNWKHFDKSADWVSGTTGIHKVRKHDASSYQNSFGIRLETDTAAWTSLKLDPISNLEPGVYTLSMTTTNAYQYPSTSNEATRHATFWFAKADSENAVDYMTDANLVRTATGGELKNAHNNNNNRTFKLGEVTITDATAEYVLVIELQGMELYISNFTLTKTGDLLSGDVNVYVDSLVNGVASKTGIEGIAPGNINAVARGTSITLTASGIDDTKEFSHWQTASGTFLSDEAEYTFTANTNTVVFAVYENVSDATGDEKVTVSFYDGFGGRIAQVAKATTTAFSEFAASVAHTGYRGYSFNGVWESVDKVLEGTDKINKNTIAVAQYEAPTAKYTVTVDGTAYGKGTYAYDEEVSVTSEDENFSYWTRNGEIVSYSPTYTFNVWGDTALVAVTKEAVTAAPVVILDKDAEDGSYMVEYSLPEGYTFVETGIVFSKSGTPSVGSCTSKASSKTFSSDKLHGQFTAKPSSSDETEARGYVIYRDAEDKLIASYAD